MSPGRSTVPYGRPPSPFSCFSSRSESQSLGAAAAAHLQPRRREAAAAAGELGAWSARPACVAAVRRPARNVSRSAVEGGDFNRVGLSASSQLAWAARRRLGGSARGGGMTEDFVAGVAGGTAGLFVGQPLDTVRVRRWRHSWPVNNGAKNTAAWGRRGGHGGRWVWNGGSRPHCGRTAPVGPAAGLLHALSPAHTCAPLIFFSFSFSFSFSFFFVGFLVCRFGCRRRPGASTAA